MARTLPEILSELKANFVANTTIQSIYGLTPGNTFEQEFSVVSFEGLLLYIIAFHTWGLENKYDQLREEIEQKILDSRRWSLPNFVADAYAFQYGDALVLQDREWKYPVINPSHQIIKVANASEVEDTVILKVAKVESGVYQELSTPEMNAFTEYILELKPPGIDLSIISRAADILRVYYHIYVNPQVINTNGELISNTSIRPVDDVILAYIRGLPYNGKFDITELTDRIQQVPGVIAPIFDEAWSKFGTLPFSQIVDFDIPNSGYYDIDDDPAYDLLATISYQTA